jgi:hypothetical protein
MTMSESDKPYKQQENRRARRVLRSLPVADEDEVLPTAKDFGDPWGGPKDGKQFVRSAEPKLMRK